MKKELLVKETYKKTEELWNKITPKFLCFLYFRNLCKQASLPTSKFQNQQTIIVSNHQHCGFTIF